MKRSLLLVLFAFIYTLGNAQVIFSVQPPSSLSGNYDHTYLNGSGTIFWPNVPDMENSANAVEGEIAMALDATTADSLVGYPVVSDVNGKIAVIYRGSYSFAGKIWRAQEAGAIGVVMVNNVEDPALITMSAEGDTAEWVTIPAVFVTMATGATLRDEVIAGGLNGFIGNKTGYYANDLAIKPTYVVRAPQAATIQDLALDETEYELGVGTWVKNDGYNDLTGVELVVSVDMGGSNLYSDTLALDTILASADSAFMSTLNFSLASYDLGVYELTYSVTSDSTESFDPDNTFITDFEMTEHSYSFANLIDGEPNNVNYFRPGEIFGEVQQCVHFMDANASRLGATGLTISATTDGDEIDGEVIDVIAYEWAVEFDNLLDTVNYPGINPDDFDLLTEGSYEFVGNAMEGESIYVAFEEAIELEDDVRYLFCLAYESDALFTAFDSDKVNYSTTQDVYLQPMFPNTSGEVDDEGNEIWYLNGFTGMPTTSIVVNMIDVDAVGIDEESNIVDVTPYPNPAREYIQIPMNDITGLTTVQIFDITGKLVSSQSQSSTGNLLKVDVSNLEAGMYTFGLRYENGDVSNFNVVIAK